MLQYVFHSQPRLFEEHTRQNIMFAKLYNQVTEDVKASQEEIKEDYRKANEELSIYYIASQPAEFSKDIVLSEKDIKDYFTKNYLDFKQPVSFNLDYIAVESEEKIKEVFSSLNKKNDLDKIAKGLNLTIKETGFFAQTDPIPGIGWSPEILNLISKLKAGEYSAPVKVDKNYYVFKLRERKEAYIPEFEKVEDKVKEGLIKVKSEEIAKNRIDECLKKLKETYQKNLKSVDFNKLAKEFGLKSNSTNLFKYGSYIEGIGASDIFWTQAKDLKENDFSEVIDMPSGFYILRLKSRVPVDEKKFEAEKENFSQQLLSQKKQEYFAKFIKELSRRSGITPPLK
jgi:parvulin-like peptidyl-prolyl isomerase